MKEYQQFTAYISFQTLHKLQVANWDQECVLFSLNIDLIAV